VINASDWVLFDMDGEVSIKNLTVFGKLSFDDSKNRTLQTDNVIVWGVLELGTPQAPYGAQTGAVARIRLRGSVTDTQTYVYIEEQTLHNKLIAVLGEVNTFGSPVPDPWLWLESTIGKGATSACVQPSSGNVTWPAGSEVVFAPTEYDQPNSDVESRFLSSPAAWDVGRQCWLLQWTQGLSNRRFAGDVPIGDNNHVSLRALIARVDRTVVFSVSHNRWRQLLRRWF